MTIASGEFAGQVAMLLGGMIGSNRGWCETPCAACPADARAIAGAIAWIDALASGLVPEHAMLCLPGTHAKWVRLRGGRIAGFSTWMTGELFALLGRHPILAPQMERRARRCWATLPRALRRWTATPPSVSVAARF